MNRGECTDLFAYRDIRVCLLAAAWGVVALLSLVSCSALHSKNATPRSTCASLDGQEIAYEVRGSGSTTLLLVHGWACDRSVWWKLQPLLAESFRVISIDLPGHGDSGVPSGDYSMSLFARAMAAVLDAEQIDRAVLVGHSNGVPAVRQFYREYPQRVQQLVLIDGALRAVVPPEMATAVIERLESPEFRVVVSGFVSSMPAPHLSAEDRAAIATMATSQSQSAVVGGFRAAIDPEIWEADPVDVPVLMINAPQPTWSDDYVSFCQELIPDLRYQLVDGVGHFIMVERPEHCSDQIEAFVRRNSR